MKEAKAPLYSSYGMYDDSYMYTWRQFAAQFIQLQRLFSFRKGQQPNTDRIRQCRRVVDASLSPLVLPTHTQTTIAVLGTQTTSLQTQIEHAFETKPRPLLFISAEPTLKMSLGCSIVGTPFSPVHVFVYRLRSYIWCLRRGRLRRNHHSHRKDHASPCEQACAKSRQV